MDNNLTSWVKDLEKKESWDELGELFSYWISDLS